jgi:hypothetical protein
MSRLEAITLDDWPDVDVGEPAFAQNWTEGPAWRFNVANLVRFSTTGFPSITCYAPYQKARRIDHAERQ